jgi:uncharacterized iron-regulated protein
MRPDRRLLGAILIGAALAAARPAGQAQAPPSPHGATPQNAAAAPHRVFATASRQPISLTAALAEFGAADVLFIGERHDSVATHRLELAILEAVGRQRDGLIVALEMFERDVQPSLDRFLAGSLSEGEFLADSRPWPRYARDYQPLVALAAARQWPVVAANIPRFLAAAVSRDGLEALANRPPAERDWFARDLSCPIGDAYFRRFQRALTGHDTPAPAADPAGSVTPPAPVSPPAGPAGERAGPAMDAATMERYYYAQCLKDETMGESIARAYTVAARDGRRPLVLSISGSFHVEHGDGVVARTRRRLPGQRLITVVVVPVESAADARPDASAWSLADYLIYTDRD